MEEKPSYYSILTADVRYDERLTPNEKLMYSEITALMQKNGICWATNGYFANLYKVSKETVSRWINHLFELNYICVQITKDAQTKQILERSITIPTLDYQKSIPIDKNVNTPIDKNVNTPIDKNVKGNNINNINNINNNNKKEINKEKVELISTLNSYKDNFSEECFNIIRDWLKYKKEKKQSYKLTGLKTLLNKLKGWKENNGDGYVIDAIQNSICNNYSGIFPKKDKQVDTPKKYGDGSAYEYIE